METAIITGASKGLGAAVAKLFLESGIHVVGISRTDNTQLYSYAKENNADYQFISCDLSEKDAIEKVCQSLEEILFNDTLSKLYLINNAGLVDPIDRAENIEIDDLMKQIHVNTVTPMALTNYFLKKATEHNIQLLTAIVTSGAADKPKYGWSVYCSTKASMNMYTQTVAIEQAETEHAIIAFSPGVMDTGMQEIIRSSSQGAFKDVESFRALKENNQLRDADVIGGVLIDILMDDNIENGKIYDVREYI
ncbi:(S)-benzoin forming benzil reductase [Oceanobacillus jeddahense]|uniref:(S)-benzoin forming benzil reductase n=1 Tax=Oceanobacillus jeddahense TaxID=1462527 RepID=A0ABY5JYM5_9BACI|nr:(S)-benzoin forming benzil reductase [Oceanobacillus jeddahense]UUI05131.1 (S)-benzoin forming benzil reductase [Oceanobacillus jeddahense]